MRKKTDHPLFRLWCNRRQCCNNPSDRQFRQYGSRGIKFDPIWDRDFWAFADWMDENLGPRPSPEYVLDRIDNNDGFHPGNLRWATKQEDSNNRVTNTTITYRRKTMTYADWARHTGINLTTIWSRVVDLGWPINEALGFKQHKKKTK